MLHLKKEVTAAAAVANCTSDSQASCHIMALIPLKFNFAVFLTYFNPF